MRERRAHRRPRPPRASPRSTSAASCTAASTRPRLVRAEDGTVKLTGAGLAEAFPPPDLRPGTAPDVARYLSPEEVSGRAPSPASDVYRLGLVTYLLLTGRHAFDGTDGSIVAQEQLDGVVRPPQLLNPEVPPALAQIVTRALDKDPGARGTAAQYQADIERVLRSAQVQEVVEERAAEQGVALDPAASSSPRSLPWRSPGRSAPSTAAAALKVPDVTGMTRPRRPQALEADGLKTGKITRVQSTDGPEGTVVGQSPAAGEQVDEGSAVDLEVAGAPAPSATPVAVPDVVGSSQAAAEAQLTGAGFTAVVTQAESDHGAGRHRGLAGLPGGRGLDPGQQRDHRRVHRPPTPTPSTSASP